MAHTLTTTTTAIQATQAGALSGHRAHCSCGFTASTSLSARFAEKDVQSHIDWAIRNGR